MTSQRQNCAAVNHFAMHHYYIAAEFEIARQWGQMFFEFEFGKPRFKIAHCFERGVQKMTSQHQNCHFAMHPYYIAAEFEIARQ